MLPLMWISVIAVYLLLLLGGIVSSTGSGLGCGSDWPLCQGQLIPSLSEPAVFLEWLHRLVAALVGLLVLATAIVTWRQSQSMPLRSKLAGIAVFLLLIQVILGAITVRLELPEEISTAHLAAGTALFTVLIAMVSIAVSQARAPVAASAASPQTLVWLAVGVTYAQMVLGAYVRHSGAGLACPDVLLCGGLPLQGPVLLQLAHRVGALVVLGVVHMTGAWVRRASGDPLLRRAALAAMSLVLIQVGLGILSVSTQLSTHATTTHLAVALLLLGALVFVATRMTLGSRLPAAEGI
jgi:cytochrome c oxidase assembly protein subunit 15